MVYQEKQMKLTYSGGGGKIPAMAGNFERCTGCPLVREGHICEILAKAVELSGINDTGVKQVKFECPKLIELPHSRALSDYGVITITKKGATYGEWGQAADELGKAFFGG